MNNPLVSICIPSYNAESFIKETLQSILDQTYTNIEIVIIDDCSKDKTVEIIQSFTDDRIKLHLNEKNLGVEGNWNKTLEFASGKYLKIMGADDILYPDCIAEQISILEDIKYKDVVLVTSNKKVIDQNGKLIIQKGFPGKKGHLNGLKALKKCIRFGTNIIGEPVSGLFRKEVLDKSGLYNGSNLYMIDLDLWSRMLVHGDIFIVEKALYAFRISTTSLSTNIGVGQIKLFYTFVDELYADKKFQINWFDKFIGKLMALLMGLARNLVYVIYFRK